MKKELFVNAYNNKQIRKGSITKAKWQSFPNKKNTDIVKITEGYVRIGVAYMNTKAMKEKVLNGEIDLQSTYVSPYKNYHNVVGCEGVLMEHNEGIKTNVILYLPLGFKNLKSVTKYYYKGQEVTKQWLLDNGLVKEYMVTSGPNETGRFMVDLNNLLRLGNLA